jgi:hypothetical protein
MYTCEKCNIELSSRKALQAHQNRKTPCDSVGNVKNHFCKFCSAAFTDSSNRYRHQKTCRQQEQDPKCIELKNQAKPNDRFTDQDMPEICQAIKDLHLTKDEVLRRIRNEQQPVVNITNNITNNGNIIQVINNFGMEDMTDLITDEIMEYCVSMYSTNGIEMLTKHIHFNDDFPANKNIRKGVRTNKTVQIKHNGAWKLSNKNTVLDKVIKDKISILYTYYIKNEVNACHIGDDLFFKWYQKMVEKIGLEYFRVRNELFEVVCSAE